MPGSNKSPENNSFLWEHRRAISVITVLGLIGIIFGSRFISNKNTETSLMGTAVPGLTTDSENIPLNSRSGNSSPDITLIGERDHTTGIIRALLFGHIDAECVRINWTKGAYSGNQTHNEYLPDDPTITYGTEALAMLGVDTSNVSTSDQVYVAKGVNLVVVGSMGDTIWENLNIGNEVCDEVK